MEKTKLLKKVSTDEILEQIGEFGRFQWILDGIFCIMLLPATFQTLIMYFAALQPEWRCVANSTICNLNGTFSSENEFRCGIPRSEWEFTQPKDYSIVTEYDIYCDTEWIVNLSTSILFLGWSVGSMILGWLADNYGRKTVLFPSLFITLLIGAISPFVPNIFIFIGCRFVVGLFLPGTALQMFIIISELVGGKHRPKAGLILWIFLTVSFCLLGIKAYFIRQWKMLFVVCTVPYVFIFAFYKFVPESVRWLRLHGKYREALNTLERIAAWNGTSLDKNISLDDHLFQVHVTRPKPLFFFCRGNLLQKSFIQGYAWLVSGMIFYGFSLSADQLGGSLYLNFILVSLVELPGICMALASCERFGRKRTVTIPMLIGGLVCGAIPIFESGLVASNLGKVVLALIGKMFITTSFNSIYTWSAELYPTELRAEGLGFCQVTSRIGAALAPWVVKGFRVLHQSSPFLVMSALAIVSAVTLLFLPETKGEDLLEDVKDLKEMDENGNVYKEIEI
ncbi:organic cation transporter-like protein [Clytia hemisphaerica]|uniref:Major facilitator superfamily (MFS) profile domain-containing protein n=1 Tax=Clytia hemisphaerica TaxID=252671 RepID=A0A7M5WXR2_9CNID